MRLSQRSAVALHQPSRSARPRWHLLYYLLAAFDLITICASLGLNHRVMQIFSESVAVNQRWADWMQSYGELGQFAAAVNAPGNDIFASRDVVSERAHLRDAAGFFERHLTTMRGDVASSPLTPDERSDIIRHFAAIEQSHRIVVTEAERVLALAGREDWDSAAQQMAVMDQAFADLNTAIFELRQSASTFQQQHLDAQQRTARAFGRYEYVIAVLILVMVIGATRYGRAIWRRMEADATERERYLAELHDAELRTRAIVESAVDGILSFDADGLIEAANASCEVIFGYTPHELLDQPVDRLIPQWRELIAGAPTAAESLSSDVLGGRVTDTMGLRRDGAAVPIDLSVSAFHLAERPLFTVIVRDVSDRRRAEEAARHEETLRRSEERFRSLVQNTSDIIMVLDEHGVARYVSPSIERVLGYPAAQIVGARPLETLVATDERPAVQAWFHALLRDGAAEQTREFRSYEASGELRNFEAVANNLLDRPSVRGVVVTLRDMTERKSVEDQLAYQAFHDALTRLPNRALFMDRVRQALERAAERNTRVALLFLDLDNFKHVNDTLGHQAGDQLLIAVASRVSQCIRKQDTLTRLGGDEFTILIDDVHDERDVHALAERITALVRAPFVLDRNEVFVGTSIGIALSAGAESAEDLLGNADVAVYQAKNQGKGQAVVFEPHMRSAVVERVALEADLRRGVERGEFMLLYQPVVDLRAGVMKGVEALVRWNHPEHGLVSPAKFIPLAEETGLIVPLGRYVLEEAARQMCRWQDIVGSATGFHVNVNLSGRQFQEAGFIDEVAALLRETGVCPSTLVLEITETVLLRDTDTTMARLRELKELGVRLAIDDFGTGYCSLSYLQRFPFDMLKVDKSFIDGIGRHTANSTLADAVIRLGQMLNLETVAEGVEERLQVDHLQRLRCDYAQGAHFAMPLPAAAIDNLLTIQLPFPLAA